MDDYFLIAEIKSAAGADGCVLIDSFSDFKNRFLKLPKVLIEVFGNKKEFLIESVREVEKGIILKFSGFDSSSDVQFLLGKKIYIEKADTVELPDNSYFIHDLIDSSVVREDQLMGTVVDFWALPANDVLVINTPDNKKILVPVIHDYIESFDAEKKRLTLVKGCDLLYDDES